MRPTTGHYGGEIAPYLAKSYSGAPRPMKMGTIASPWRYDAAAYDTPTPSNTRPIAIWRCAHGGQFSDATAARIGGRRTIPGIWQMSVVGGNPEELCSV
jgi:hypothetical protein